MRPLSEPAFRRVLLAHFATTCAMAGVIWIVQLVIYPLFSRVGGEAFPVYHQHYTALVTFVVGPLMLVELATSLIIVAQLYRKPRLCSLAIAGLIAIGLLWLVTATVQVPAHDQLSAGLDVALAGSLVLGNWVRTALWSIRVPLAWLLLERSLTPSPMT